MARFEVRDRGARATEAVLDSLTRPWAKAPMKQSSFAISALPAFCLVSILSGCQLQPQPWHLQAHREGETVQLCLSQQPECPQPGGLSTDDISVYRYDNLHDNELVWDTSRETESTNDKFDGVVTYGVPPKNWTNKLTPPALVCGKAYLVNPATLYFALKCDGTVVVFDSPHLEEFFEQEASRRPAATSR
jgi:hypothetical protein